MISNKMKDMIANSSAIRAMFEEGKRLAKIHGEENVFDFSIGNPNAEPPLTIVESIHDILAEEKPMAVHGYMNNSGYEDVRLSIAKHLNQKYQLDLETKHIVMTCGAAGGINVLFKAMLNPGDEIITFAPFFGEYRSYSSNFDAKLKVIPAKIDDFQPDIEALKAAITPLTKIVLINSPNNPTGVVYTEETLIQLGEVLRAYSEKFGTTICLVSDEPYREVAYDNIHIPYLLKYYENSIVIYSYSKSLSLPGERIGYIALHPQLNDMDLLTSGLNVATRILGFINAPSLFQKVVARNLDAEVDVSFYQKNRDVMYDYLISLGFECVKPEGAFYLFPRTPIADDVKFCTDAKQFNLLIVPGTAFGCPGHFRIAYCVAHEKIVGSLPAFKKLWELYAK